MMNYDKSYFFVRKKEELMESVGERRDKTCENHHLRVFVLLLSLKYSFSCKKKIIKAKLVRVIIFRFFNRRR